MSSGVEEFPNPLWHYTSRQGLIDIIGSGVLRAGHADFMNDPTERSYAMSMVKNGEEGSTDFWTESRGFASLFFISFTSEGDLKSQWHAYGENGQGYSIGFDLTKLHSVVLATSQGLSEPRRGPVQPMVYDPEAQRRLLREGAAQQTELRGEVLVRIKHPEFREEKEWRFFQRVSRHFSGSAYRSSMGELPESKVEFSSHANGIKPYVNVALDTYEGMYGMGNIELAPKGKLPITEIICGWQSGSDHGIDAVHQLLEKNGYGDVDVRQSRVPLVP